MDRKFDYLITRHSQTFWLGGAVPLAAKASEKNRLCGAGRHHDDGEETPSGARRPASSQKMRRVVKGVDRRTHVPMVKDKILTILKL